MTKLFIRVLAFVGAFPILIAVAGTNTFTENFTANPTNHGWQIFGNPALFQWDSTNHDLNVTWDSSQPNSYFYHPLGVTLGEQDGFSLEFDLQLSNAVSGGDNGFEISMGFFNLAEATGPDFFRGTGYQSPDLVEFDYFPPFGEFGASIDTTLIDTLENFQFYYDDVNSLSNGVDYHVVITHAAGDSGVGTTVYTYEGAGGGLSMYSTLPYYYAYGAFTDFFVDTISISSYNDYGADGSILATGTIANLTVTTDTRPIGTITGGMAGPVWEAQFSGRTNWTYTLERSADLKQWTPASPPTAGSNAFFMLQDTNPPANIGMYRVRASQ